jgi:hypothetical protein
VPSDPRFPNGSIHSVPVSSQQPARTAERSEAVGKDEGDFLVEPTLNGRRGGGGVVAELDVVDPVVDLVGQLRRGCDH